MSRRILLLLACIAGCSAPVQSHPVEQVQLVVLPPPPPPVADSETAEPGDETTPRVDLSGVWATGSGNEPDVRRLVEHLECNYTPSFWIIEQRGDTVRSWTNPASRAQGIATPPRARPAMAEGRIRGVNVRMKDSESRYVLRYDAKSEHLRGTLNGERFWAVRKELVSAAGCIPVP